MRILVLKPVVVAKTNGGEISLLARLNELKRKGATIHVACALSRQQAPGVVEFLKGEGASIHWNEDSGEASLEGGEAEGFYEMDGLRIDVTVSSDFHPHDLKLQPSMEHFFRRKIEIFRPDAIVTHYTDFFATSAAIQCDPQKTFVLLTDHEYPRLTKMDEFPSLKSQYRRIQNFVVASRFMQRSARRDFPGAKVLLVPNPISPVAPRGLGSHLLFVNPIPVKGLEFVCELARALPQEKFLFVGNWATASPPTLPSNVRWLHRNQKIFEMFEQAKVLLHPSHWEEAFGRLVLEAMSAGLPVISSDRGALKDTVGEGGMVLPLKKELWIEAIRSNAYLAYQKAGKERFHAYELGCRRRFDALWRLMRRVP